VGRRDTRSQGLKARRDALSRKTTRPPKPPKQPKQPKQPKPPRQPLSLRFKLIATVIVVTVLGGAAEWIARDMGLQIPSLRRENNNQIIMIPHPTRLWGMAEGVKENAGAKATINKLGLRGEIPTQPRQAGEQRVMIFGDSTFFGHGVEDDETLSVLLEDILQEQGIEATVINAAVPGYSTEQVRLLLDDVGWDLEPTLLIMGCLWSDNNWDFFRDRDLLRTQGKFHDNPLASSHFYQLLSGKIDQLKGGEGARIVTWTRTSEWPSTGKRRVSLQRYAENLDAITQEAARRGAGMMLLRPVNVEGVEEIPFDGGYSWDPYTETQLQMGAFHSIPVVSLLPPFQATFKQLQSDPATAKGARRSLFLDRMHPTPLGHKLIAEAIAEHLQLSGWPDNPLQSQSDADFPMDQLPPDEWRQRKEEVGKQLSPFQGMFETRERTRPGPR